MYRASHDGDRASLFFAYVASAIKGSGGVVWWLLTSNREMEMKQSPGQADCVKSAASGLQGKVRLNLYCTTKTIHCQ